MSVPKPTTPTPDEIRQWPAVVKAVPDAASAFDLAPDVAYRLIREGTFPCRVLKLGRQLKVTRAALMDALGIPERPYPAPSNSLATGVIAQFNGSASEDQSEVHRGSRAA